MDQPPFNPSEAITFDLTFGHVHLDGAPHRVLVPADGLMDLCLTADDESIAAFGYGIGTAMGKRVAQRLAGNSTERPLAVGEAPFETVIEHLAGELALAGFGSLGAERWGKAVIMVHDQSPFGERGDVLLGSLLEAALHALGVATGRVVKLERAGARARYLVVSPAAVEGVRMRLRDGQHWGAVVAKLHRKGASD